jgi:protein involved in polysaccharide export with SLBB domain
MFMKVMTVGLAVFVAVALSGCFSSHPADVRAFLKPQQTNVSAENYVLQPPDEVEIQCSKVPEIHKQRQRIRPDGKISYEGLGEIEVAGKTVEQVAGSLRAKVLELYKLADEKPIDVRVVTYRSKVYYVLGEVYVPGPKEYTGRDTVLSALAEAQINPMAWKERIQIIRPSADKTARPQIFEVSFDKMAAHGDTSKNVLLQEGDVIYVPPTVLAAIAMVIEEFVRPIGRAFSTVSIVTRASYGGGGYGGGY